MPSDRFFENFKFRFTPAKDLNDPREIVPVIRIKDPAAYVQDIVIRNISRNFLRAQIANPQVSAEAIWKIIRANNYQFIRSFDVGAKEDEIFSMVMNVTNQYVGVLSLTEDPLNELMWAHYAANHSGFVVGIDKRSEFFQPKPGEPKVCGKLMKVIYTDTTPVVFVNSSGLEIPKEIFFTKTIKWSYEREWRMIKFLEHANDVVTVKGKKIHLFDVPKAAVKEIIFGKNISADFADVVQAKLSNTARHIVIKQASFTPKEGLIAKPR